MIRRNGWGNDGPGAIGVWAALICAAGLMACSSSDGGDEPGGNDLGESSDVIGGDAAADDDVVLTDSVQGDSFQDDSGGGADDVASLDDSQEADDTHESDDAGAEDTEADSAAGDDTWGDDTWGDDTSGDDTADPGDASVDDAADVMGEDTADVSDDDTADVSDEDTGDSSESDAGEPDAGGSACDDGDDDGYGEGCAAGPDCAPNDALHWADCGSCQDGDGDGRGTDCDLGADCDDDDPDVWVSCGSCVDLDEDEYFAGCDAYTEHDGPDCDDSAFWIRPGVVELPGDGVDQDCDGSDLEMDDATGIFVSPNGTPGGAGTKAEPLDEIQAAIDMVDATRHHIYVAAGTYGPVSYVEAQPIGLYGGYDPTSWARDMNLHVSRIVGAEKFAVSLQGTFAIQGFNVEPAPAEVASGFCTGIYAGGPGIVADNHVEASDCELLQRLVSTSGGGRVWIARNQIDGGDSGAHGIDVAGSSRSFAYQNVVTGGEVALRSSGSPHIIAFRNTFVGGGDSVAHAGTVVRGYGNEANNIVLIGNHIRTGPWASTAVQTTRGNTTLINNTIVVDTEFDGSTGVDAPDPNANIAQVIAAGNLVVLASTGTGTTGFELEQPYTLNNNLVAHTVSVQGYVIDGEVATVESANSCSPDYCNAASGNATTLTALTEGGWALVDPSAAIDAGVNPADYGYLVPAEDFEGNPRPVGSGWDIGADEYPAQN